MTKTLKWLVVLGLSVSCHRLVQSSSDSPDAGLSNLLEREPNDKFEQAQVVSPGSSNYLTIHGELSLTPKADEDWFALMPASSNNSDLDLEFLPEGNLLANLEIYDEGRRRRMVLRGDRENPSVRLNNLSLKNRTLVRIWTTEKEGAGAYQMKLSYHPPIANSEIEPNDRAVDATFALLGQPISGYMGYTFDEDWYRYDTGIGLDAGTPFDPGGRPDTGVEADAGTRDVAPVGTSMKIELTPLAGVVYELRVMSAAQASLFQVSSKMGEGLSLRNVGIRATDKSIFVSVKAKHGHNTLDSYRLSLNKEEGGANAEMEPNDEPSKATPLPLIGYREGFLSPKSDIDYYVLKTTEPMSVKAELSGVDNLDLILSLVKPALKSGEHEEILIRSNDGEVKEPEYLNGLYCNGECYFKVEGALRKIDGKWARTFENTEQPYRLSISSAVYVGTEEREPNGTPATATPIELGHLIRGTIQPQRDVDYYKLDLSQKPVKTPITLNLSGILKVHLGLYLHQIEADGKPKLVQTADSAKADSPEVIHYSAEPGLYLIEIRDSNPKALTSNFQDSYQLMVDEGGP